MVQHQAAYTLGALKDHFIEASESGEETYRLVRGLLNHLSTFDLKSPNDLPSSPRPILAVANNIVTRGLPTLASEFVEEEFAKCLNLTERSSRSGSIHFTLKRHIDTGEVKRGVLQAMHIVDPRAKVRNNFLYLDDTDSQFERNFLLQLIPETKSYLAQLLQHQRRRDTITRDRNAGRVDFSFEVPYFRVEKRQNRFHRDVAIKTQKRFVVEVDGRAYHTQLIDDLKDFELAQMPTTINHIREDSTFADLGRLLGAFSEDPYIQQVEQNFGDASWITNPLTSLVLSPILVARIQKTIIEYLITSGLTYDREQTITLAVVERDIPAARIAVQDLAQLLANLNALCQNPSIIPTFQLTVFATTEYVNHPLHLGTDVRLIDECNPGEFDLVLDVSILRRSGIFKDDSRFESDRTWIVRSSHFTDKTTTNPIYCANPIVYKAVTKEISNEVHEEIGDVKSTLSYFLRNIFRKESFREGQLPILNRALQRKSVIGLLPTGGGKSLTYQLAAVLQPGITLVVDPIRSLMVDQYRGLREIGFDRCEFINSTLSSAERRYNQNHLLPEGRLQFVFVSPERFVIREFRDALATTAENQHCFSYVVIDEVHCVSEWGHDFRTPYLNLGRHSVQFCRTWTGEDIPLFGLTATASFDVLADIERELQIPDDDGNAVVRYENTVRDEINYSVKEVNIDENALGNRNIRNIRQVIGSTKQLEVVRILQAKQQLLDRFNTDEALERIVKHSWEFYLPVTVKQRYEAQFQNSEEAYAHYSQEQRRQLQIEGAVFPEVKFNGDRRQYQYGAVVFAPHRKGALGIIEGGLYSNNEHVTHFPDGVALCGDDSLGYFMGSGDGANADQVDKESFENLDKFIKNQISVMVATKAFGMGIDKPNVRLTVHINIPQSIESFVQEAGRAGRDKKISHSILLFNQQSFEATDGGRTFKDFMLDRDVLLYFHRKSFKGHVKERTIIHELRMEVTFPMISNGERVSQLIQELFGNDQTHFTIKRGRNNWADFLFVSAGDDLTVGQISISNRAIRTYNAFADSATCQQIMETVRNEIPAGINQPALDQWLRQTTISMQQQTGLERMLDQLQDGQTSTLQIPFTNRYYTPPPQPGQDYRLNPSYVEVVLSSPMVNRLIVEKHVTKDRFVSLLKEANRAGEAFDEFVDRLQIEDDELVREMKNTERPDRLYINYCKSRGEDDTAKAIYRLISIGVIDAYTIDYQNKLYTVQFTKKDPNKYFEALETLMARYTSRRNASQIMDELMQAYQVRQQAGTATALSFCLEQLTLFVYKQIQERRLQAIEDMVSLCRVAATMTADHLEQNEFLKDEIYFYFNAKYSRRGFVEPGTESPASLIDDREADLPIGEQISKYLRLCEDPRTGQLLNNAKHLRGSTMRMIRSYGEDPAYLILKSFALLVLSTVVPALQAEAKRELVKGMILWRQQDQNFNPVRFIHDFRERVSKHVYDHIVVQVFTDIEDLYFTGYYVAWTKQFTTKNS